MTTLSALQLATLSELQLATPSGLQLTTLSALQLATLSELKLATSVGAEVDPLVSFQLLVTRSALTRSTRSSATVALLKSPGRASLPLFACVAVRAQLRQYLHHHIASPWHARRTQRDMDEGGLGHLGLELKWQRIIYDTRATPISLNPPTQPFRCLGFVKVHNDICSLRTKRVAPKCNPPARPEVK